MPKQTLIKVKTTKEAPIPSAEFTYTFGEDLKETIELLKALVGDKAADIINKAWIAWATIRLQDIARRGLVNEAKLEDIQKSIDECDFTTAARAAGENPLAKLAALVKAGKMTKEEAIAKITALVQ